MINVIDLIRYAKDAVGGGYVYGSSGQVSSLSFRQSCAAANPSQSANILGLAAKWDGKRVWDCSGIFRGAWEKLLKKKSGGATTIYKTWCTETGPIGTMPDQPGIAVFKGTESPLNMAHIGLFVGDGNVIDARGTAQGVMYGPFSSVAWTHWGRLADVAYEGYFTPEREKPMYQAMQTNATKGLNLRPSPSMNAATKLLVPLNAVLDIYQENQGADKSFAYVNYMGVFGYCTRHYLSKLLPEDEPEVTEETVTDTPDTSQKVRLFQGDKLSLLVYPPVYEGVNTAKAIIPVEVGDRIVLTEFTEAGQNNLYSADITDAGTLAETRI